MASFRAIGLLVAATSSAATVAGPETFADRLARAARGEFDAGLMVVVECQTKEGPRTAAIFGEGTAVWNERTQFTLPKDRIRAVVAVLERAGFASMPERFGGRDNAPLAAAKGAAVVTCRILAKLDDAGNAKEVVQLETGHQSQAFRRLALDILRPLERPAASGVTPRSLADALGRIADGELSPMTLEVIAAHGGSRPADAQATRWMLAITGGLVETRLQEARKLSDPVRMRPDPAALRRLARVLAEDAAALPANISAADATDLNVRVLGWKTSVQARPFAGANAARQDGPDQQRLQRIVDALRALHTSRQR